MLYLEGYLCLRTFSLWPLVLYPTSYSWPSLTKWDSWESPVQPLMWFSACHEAKNRCLKMTLLLIVGVIYDSSLLICSLYRLTMEIFVFSQVSRRNPPVVVLNLTSAIACLEGQLQTASWFSYCKMLLDAVEYPEYRSVQMVNGSHKSKWNRLLL